jgi:hypothetical protein
MRYRQLPIGLIEETRALIRLYLFLRYDCGLHEADRLSAKELKLLLGVIKRGII